MSAMLGMYNFSPSNDEDFMDNYRLPDEVWNLNESNPYYYANSRSKTSSDLIISKKPEASNGSEQNLPLASATMLNVPAQSVMMNTPPNSPPSSDLKHEHDLDILLNVFPEILDSGPIGASYTYGAILNELHLTTYNNGSNAVRIVNPEEQLPSPPVTAESFLSPPTIDNTCSGGTGLKGELKKGATVAKPVVKLRKVSGSSTVPNFLRSTGNSSPIMIHDYEYEHLPETPGMSDADEAELNDASEKSCQARMINSFINASVKNEHNYCEKKHFTNASIDTPSFSDSDDDAGTKVKVERLAPYHYIKRPFKIVFKQSSKHAIQTKVIEKKSLETVPTASSMEVKQQLLRTVKESMKNKKVLKISQEQRELDNTSDSLVIPAIRTSDLIQGYSIQTSNRTHGKSEAYTKRMMDQHSEVVKKGNKKRKLATDPCDNFAKRKEHNKLERIRRINLKNLFNDLRANIPALSGDRKASKVTILKEAANQAQIYRNTERNRNELLEKQKMLLKRLEAVDRRAAEVFRQTNRVIL